MNRFAPFAAVVVLAILAPNRSVAQADARVLIDQAVAAHGGADVLAKHPAARIKVKGTYLVQGKELAYSGQSVFLLPDRVRSAVELTIDGKPHAVTQIQNGEKSAMIVGGMSQHVPEVQVQELKLSLYCQNLAHLTPLLKDSKYALTAAGDKMIDDKPVNCVRVTSAGQKDVLLCFDATTHLLAMLERPGHDAKGGKIDQQEFYSDYRVANGIKYAGKTRVVQGGKVTLQSEVVE